MDAIIGFLAGLVARLGLVFAIPLAFAVVIGGAVIAMRVFGRKPAFVESKAGLMAFDPLALYAPSHLWLREAGARLRVGLDDLALRLLPGVTAVEVPAAGAAVKAGEPLARLRIGEVEVAIPAPADGRVALANGGARTTASLHGEGGWLVELEPAGEAHRALPKGEAARAWLAQEAGRLVGFAERELGLAAADGGEVAIHSVSAVPEEKWRALLKDFLKAEPRKAA